MYYGEKKIEHPLRWAMVGGGKGSQIGYIHRSAALRDFSFTLVAGAFDIDPQRGKEFGEELHVLILSSFLLLYSQACLFVK